MIQEIMSMSTDEIKKIFDHTKNLDSNNFPLLDALYYLHENNIIQTKFMIFIKINRNKQIYMCFKGIRQWPINLCVYTLYTKLPFLQITVSG